MNGILVVDKEKDYTSRDVVNKVSKILHTKKVGHTGTLDPLATGVLVLCIGEATKLVEIITSYEKEYIASVVLGTSTDTLDITGNILEEKSAFYKKEQIEQVLSSFQKTYEQEAPIYSAIKINGKKLYEYAREGIQVDLPKRKVTIHDICLVGDVLYEDQKTIFSFKATVSKGTYIRSLIRDIAQSLGTIGTMKDLRRTKQGAYLIENACTLSAIEKGNYPLLKIDTALTSYKHIIVEDVVKEKIKNGAPLSNIYQTEYPLFVDKEGVILALYKPYKENLIKPFKMFHIE